MRYRYMEEQFMSEKVRVLISEEEVEKRICEMGKEISEYLGLSSVTYAIQRRVFYLPTGKAAVSASLP